MLVALNLIITIVGMITLPLGLSLSISKILTPYAFVILGVGIACAVIASLLQIIIGKAKIAAQKKNKKYLPHYELKGKKLAGS